MPALGPLSPTQIDAVRALAAACQDADGHAPFNEEALLGLADPHLTHAVIEDGRVIAYAQYHRGFDTAQLAVHPDHRRQGHGQALIDAITADAPAVCWWAFGNMPAARALAARNKLIPRRGLHIMSRPLTDLDAPRPAPEGVRLRPFTDADADAFLTVNERAFSHHPEQGQFTRSDLDARRAESWFSNEGLIVAEDAHGLVGFHWTKPHGRLPDGEVTGEVYVLGVDPRAAGRGLGGILLDAGLQHLKAQGCTRVLLYVDAGNERAINLYRAGGFDVTSSDKLYGPPIWRAHLLQECHGH